MMRSYISITWTPGVDIRDAQILGRAIEDIFSLVRPQFGPIPGQFDPLPVVRVFGAWAIPAMPGGSPYSNIEWYVNRSLADNREDILASRYLDTPPSFRPPGRRRLIGRPRAAARPAWGTALRCRRAGRPRERSRPALPSATGR